MKDILHIVAIAICFLLGMTISCGGGDNSSKNAEGITVTLYPNCDKVIVYEDIQVKSVKPVTTNTIDIELTNGEEIRYCGTYMINYD